jgi:hypothetical protein
MAKNAFASFWSPAISLWAEALSVSSLPAATRRRTLGSMVTMTSGDEAPPASTSIASSPPVSLN